MPIEIDSDEVACWLEQFTPSDQSSAQELLSQITFVSADMFLNDMTSTLQGIQRKLGSPVALFAEREIASRGNTPPPLYKFQRSGVRRSDGAGSIPFRTSKEKKETGSEGIVANLITGLARSNRDLFLDHPSMNQIREKKPRHFILVADFIGSGKRAYRYLEAAWRTPSIVSWMSYGLVRFLVVTYSATEEGEELLQSHRCSPSVNSIFGCPRLSLLPTNQRNELVKLCEKYSPPPSASFTALGYHNTGSLISFAHGMPNNAPLVLHVKSKEWEPIFRSRSTRNVTITDGRTAKEKIESMAFNFADKRFIESICVSNSDLKKYSNILVLVALKRPPRSVRIVSARTGLPIKAVYSIIFRAKNEQLLTEDLRLTDAGHREIGHFRRKKRYISTLAQGDDSYYYPTMLRSPIDAFR